MFAEAHNPEHLPAEQLDAYLEQGWFRMGQTIFTTNFVHLRGAIHSAIWLRVVLNEYEPGNTEKKLFKNNARFQTEIEPAELTAEKEELYEKYRVSLPFVVSESVQHLLFGHETGESIYTTYEVTVRDKGELIACGFFDLGSTSGQGITSFYNPAYKKYSLGKYLIYKKMQYCKNLGMQYFYPGYFVPGNSYFDYKLTIGRKALQFLTLRTAQWMSMDVFQNDDIPINMMQQKLAHVHDLLIDAGLSSHVLKYEFFDANLISSLRNSGLLDYPVFLCVVDVTDDLVNPILVFDVRDDQYHLWMCAPVWKPDGINPDPAFYSAFFLKPMQKIFASANPEVMAAVLVKFFERAVIKQ